MVSFDEFLTIWSLRSNSVTRQATFDRTKIDWKCQNWKSQNATFWVIFKHCDVIWVRAGAFTYHQKPELYFKRPISDYVPPPFLLSKDINCQLPKKLLTIKITIMWIFKPTQLTVFMRKKNYLQLWESLRSCCFSYAKSDLDDFFCYHVQKWNPN